MEYRKREWVRTQIAEQTFQSVQVHLIVGQTFLSVRFARWLGYLDYYLMGRETGLVVWVLDRQECLSHDRGVVQVLDRQECLSHDRGVVRVLDRQECLSHDRSVVQALDRQECLSHDRM